MGLSKVISILVVSISGVFYMQNHHLKLKESGLNVKVVSIGGSNVFNVVITNKMLVLLTNGFYLQGKIHWRTWLIAKISTQYLVCSSCTSESYESRSSRHRCLTNWWSVLVGGENLL